MAVECLGLIFYGSEDAASERTENRRLTPPLQGIPANIRINRIISHWATSSLLIVWVYLHSSFCAGLRKRMYFESECVWLSRSSNVVDFDTNRKRVCDFRLVINGNLVLSCTVSETLQTFC